MRDSVIRLVGEFLAEQTASGRRGAATWARKFGSAHACA